MAAFRGKKVDKSQDKSKDGIVEREYPFCIFFTSQAGTVILAFVGMTLMLITAMFNMYAENPEKSTAIIIIQYCLLFLYLAIMFFGFLLAFLAAFWEIGKYLRIATFFVGAGTLIYLIMSILSFIPDRSCVLSTCPALRCPDHHWLLEARWRHIVLKCAEGNAGSCEENSTTTSTGGLSFLRNTGVTFSPFRPFRSTTRRPVTTMVAPSTLKPPLVRPKREEGEGDGGGGGGGDGEDDGSNTRGSGRGGNVLLMIVSVLYTLLILFFFVYSIITFVAYSKQLEE